MSERLATNHYSSMEDFREDFMLIVKNCRQFNYPGTYPVDCAAVLQKAFEKELAMVAEKKMTYPEKRSLQGVMNKIVADDM